MKLLLCSNKGFIGLLIETDVPENGSSNERSDLIDLHISDLTDGSTTIEVVGLVRTTLGIFIFSRYILKARVSVDYERRSGRLFMQSNL